jgi:glycosyltransferase involved in cell wall biosynthesis
MIEGLGVGGSERQLAELLRRLDRHVFEPRLYCMKSGPMVDEIHDLGIPVTLLGKSLGGGKVATVFAIREILRIRPHVIHSYGFVGNTWACVCGVAARTPLVITGYRGVVHDLTRLQSAVERATRPMQDHAISNSEADRQTLRARGIPGSKISVVHNGLDLERFHFPPDKAAARKALGLNRDRATIGMVASFTPVKRWDVFLRAAAAIGETRSIQVLCVGEGVLRREMEVLAERVGVRGSANFLGVRSDVADVMAALDVLISSSDSEGLSNVIMEAMALGVPVVATAVGGTPELVYNGRTGCLVPRREPARLARAVERLLESQDERRQMGIAARERIETEFSIDKCVSDTIKIYRSQLEQKGFYRLAATLAE